MNSNSSSSSSDIGIIILDSGQIYTMPNEETREIMINFTGKIGSRATIILNSLPYTIGNVGTYFCWNIGKTSYTFATIDEKTAQLSGEKLYIITWKGYEDLVFTIRLDTDYDAELEGERYRFNGFRYSCRGPSQSGPDNIVPEVSSLYPFPKNQESIIKLLDF